MSSRPPLRPRLLLPAVLICLGTTPLFAQSQDELFQPFALKPLRGHLFLDGMFRHENRDSGSGNRVLEEMRFQQGIELNSGGWFYHPNLFDWNGTLRLGAVEQETFADTDDRSTFNTLLGYNFDGILFRQKPVSMRVFSSYDQNSATRDFADPIDYVNQHHGAELRHRTTNLVTSLLLDYTQRVEESETRDSDLQNYRARLRSEYRTKDLELDLEYEHQDQIEIIDGTEFDTVIDTLTLRNAYYFGEEPLRHTLIGHTLLNRNEGSYDNEGYNISQRLTLYHDTTLNSFYGGSVRQNVSDGQDDRAGEINVGVTKNIYESLVLTATLFYEFTEFIGGSDDRFGGELNATYNKVTPIGIYNQGLNVSRTYERQRSDQGARRIVGEPVTLNNLDFVALNQTNVQAGSIVVQNLTRSITYVEGIHYNVRVTGVVTELQRIEGAVDGITSGQTVLVDYTIDLPNRSDIVRDEFSWSHRLDIEELHLSPFVTFAYTEESLIAGDDPGNLQTTTTITAGVDYTLGSFLAGYEFQNSDSNINLSYYSHRIHALYNHTLSRDAVFSVGGEAQWLTYTNADDFDTEPGRDFEDSYAAYAQFNHRLTNRLLWRMRGEYRDITGRQNTSIGTVSTGLEWRFRQIEFSIDGRYRFYDQESSKGDLAEVMFRLKRYF
jgi:hypothetical protein